MTQINRNYSPWEAAILVQSHASSGIGERAMAGDIRAMRRVSKGIGRATRSDTLWVRLEGLEEERMSQLSQPLIESGIRYDKRRYCIPFARLKRTVSTLDVSRIRDKNDIYQPLMGDIDQDLIPGRTTYADALTILQGEGQTLEEARATLAPLITHIKIEQEKEAHRIQTLQLFRIDGTFYLRAPVQYRTEGFFLAPVRALSVFGLVFDKRIGRYL